MEKSEIINKFLEQGFLLSPKILDQLTEEKISSILPALKTKNTLVVKELDEPELGFTIKKQDEKKVLSVRDFADYYNKKYSLIKDILSAKLTPVSISKLSQSSGKSTIIGVVYEKTPLGFAVEDPTGRIEAKLAETEKHTLQPPQPIPVNSILGFTGELKEKTFFVSSVVYPDIPIDKKIKETNLLLKLSLENNKPKITINNEKEIEIPLPGTVSIKKGQTINILAYKPENIFTKNQAIESLKLRYLPEPKIPNENFIIEDEPDIFWIIQKEPWTENYKGVKIVSGELTEVETGRRN